MPVHACTPGHLFRGQMTTPSELALSIIVWVPGIELRLSLLDASAFSC